MTFQLHSYFLEHCSSCPLKMQKSPNMLLSSVFLKLTLFTAITRSHDILVLISSKTQNSFCNMHAEEGQLLQLVKHTLVSSAVCTSLFLLPAYIICCSGLHPVVVWGEKKKLHLVISTVISQKISKKSKLKAELGHFFIQESDLILYVQYQPCSYFHTWHLKSISWQHSYTGSIGGLNTHLYFCLETSNIAANRIRVQNKTASKAVIPTAAVACWLHYIQFFAILLFLEDSQGSASYTPMDLYSICLSAKITLRTNPGSLNVVCSPQISATIEGNWLLTSPS